MVQMRKIIPSYKCAQMDKWKLCFTQNNMGALWSIFMKSWAILGSNEYTICFKHNTSGKGLQVQQKKIMCMVCDWVQASFNAPTL